MSRVLRRFVHTTRCLRTSHPITRLENSAASQSDPPPSPPPSESQESPTPQATQEAERNDSNLPVPLAGPSKPPISQKPPFNTYEFISRLREKGDFPEGQSKALMLVTEELLRDRAREAKEETISRGDLENQAYLFRAALSELRSENSIRGRADSAAIRAALGGLKKEVDGLGQKLKEDIDTLKHEIQMEMNSRKNDSRMETKVAEISMEELSHKSTITIGDLRTIIEQAKWNNTRRGVAVIAFFVVFIVASAELMPKKVKPPPANPESAPPAAQTSLIPQLDLRQFEKDDH